MDNKIKINAYCHECGEKLEVLAAGTTGKTEISIEIMPCRSCIRKAASQPDVEAEREPQCKSRSFNTMK